jgi:signal transduction histidine kinase
LLFFRRRPLLVLPIIVTNVALLAASGYPVWRVVVVAASAFLSTALQLVTAFRLARGEEFSRATFSTSLSVALLWSIAIVLTGGVTSPFAPLLLVVCAVNVVSYGRGRESVVTVAALFVVTIVTAFLPAKVVGPDVPYPFSVAIATTVMLTSLLSLGSILRLLTDAFDHAGTTIDRMSADVLEHAQARARSLESLSARLAHEIKNPLAAIKGLANLVARASLDARNSERLAVIESEVARMEEIIRDYLSFSKPLEVIDMAPVELGGLIDDVLGILEARASAAQVSLAREPGAATVVGDRRRLLEALLNLTANAIEATPPGGSVTVRAEPSESGATLRVHDTGRGLTPEELGRIGTPFHTTRPGGTGLGVVLARTVLRQHGGDLVYESEKGKGTTALAHIPAQPPIPSPTLRGSDG